MFIELPKRCQEEPKKTLEKKSLGAENKRPVPKVEGQFGKKPSVTYSFVREESYCITGERMVHWNPYVVIILDFRTKLLCTGARPFSPLCTSNIRRKTGIDFLVPFSRTTYNSRNQKADWEKKALAVKMRLAEFPLAQPGHWYRIVRWFLPHNLCRIKWSLLVDHGSSARAREGVKRKAPRMWVKSGVKPWWIREKLPRFNF